MVQVSNRCLFVDLNIATFPYSYDFSKLYGGEKSKTIGLKVTKNIISEMMCLKYLYLHVKRFE